MFFCPECDARVISTERRPNGNSKCDNGHSFPTAHAISADDTESDDDDGEQSQGYVLSEDQLVSLADDEDYRRRVEPAMEGLAEAFARMGVQGDLTDAEWVSLAAGKLVMMHEMLIAAGISPGLMQAILRG